jgi:hypothetical protein
MDGALHLLNMDARIADGRGYRHDVDSLVESNYCSVFLSDECKALRFQKFDFSEKSNFFAPIARPA